MHYRAAIGDGDAVAGVSGAVAGVDFYGVGTFVQRHGSPECFSGGVKLKGADGTTIDVQTDTLAGFHIAHLGQHSGRVDGGFAAILRRSNAHCGREAARFIQDFGIGGVRTKIVPGAHPNAIDALAQVELGRNSAGAGVIGEIPARAVHRQFYVVFTQHIAHRCAESEHRLRHCGLPSRRIGDGHARRITHRRRRRRQHHAFQYDEHIGIGRAGGIFGGNYYLVATFLKPEVECKLIAAEAERRLATIHAAIHIAGAAHFGDAGAHYAVGVVGVVRTGRGCCNVNDGRQYFGLGRRTETIGEAEVGVVVHVFVGRRPLVPVQNIGAGKGEPMPGVQAQRRRNLEAEFNAQRGHGAKIGRIVISVGIGFVGAVQNAAFEIAQDGRNGAVIVEIGVSAEVFVARSIRLVHFAVETVEADTAVNRGDDTRFAAQFFEGKNEFSRQLADGGAVVLENKTLRFVQIGRVVQVVQSLCAVERFVVLNLKGAQRV